MIEYINGILYLLTNLFVKAWTYLTALKNAQITYFLLTYSLAGVSN